MTALPGCAAAVAFLMASLAVGGCQGDPSVARKVRYQRATELLDRGKPQAAVVELKAAIEIDDRWAPAHRKLGEIYLALGKVDNALSSFQQAGRLDPENLELLLDIAQCEIKLGRLTAAKKHLDRYCERIGNTAQVDRLRGEIAHGEGDVEAAKSHFQAAIEADPANPDSHYGLARLAVAADDLPTAADELAAAAVENPNDLKVQYGLAEVATRMGDLGRANEILDHIGEIDQQQVLNRLLKIENLIRAGERETALRQVTALGSEFPKLGRAQFLRGFLLLAKGEVPAATEALTAATALNDNDASAHFYLGAAHLAQGQAEQARAHLARARELRPDFALGRALLVEAMIAVGDVTTALSTATALVADQPDLAMGRLALADATATVGSTAVAIAQLQELIAAQPDWAEPALHLARLYRQTGQGDKAAPLYAQELDKAPDSLAMRVEYCDLLTRQTAWQELLTTTEAGLERTPDAPELITLKGIALGGLGQTDAAKTLLSALHADHPEHAAGAMNLARLYANEGDIAAAVTVLRETTTANPASSRPRALLGHLLRQQGHRDEAIALFEEATKKDARAQDLAALVTLYVEDGKNDAAVRTARHLRADYPDLPAAHLFLVQTLASAGKSEEAVIESQALATHNPGSPQALNLHAALQVVAGKPEAAVHTWDQSLHVNPDQPAVHIDLARLLLKLGRLDEARRHADEVTRALPEVASSHLLLGKVLEAQGDRKGAAVAFTRGQSLDPERPEVLAEVAAFYLRADDLAEAETRFLAIVERAPDFEPALLRSAMIAERQKRFDVAAQRYKRLLAAHPDHVVGLNNVAWVLAEELGKPEEAVSRAEAANELRPQQWWILDTLSWALAKAGRQEEALRRLDEAQKLRPDAAVLYYHQGAILADHGDTVGAVVALNRALKISSEFPEAPAARSLLEKLKQ
jgi:tetratricopeptide (TPR) repeat protein